MNEWNRLSKDKKHLVEDVRRRWLALLDDDQGNESHYHEFLKNYSGLFYADSVNRYFSISKLQFGSEFVTDFVVPIDNASHGFRYEMIEIESPHTKPFLKTGAFSARLSQAIQQVSSWKNWVSKHLPEVQRLFPSKMGIVYKKPMFDYSIIIGRRVDYEEHVEMLDSYIDSMDITIHSFDYFTSRLEKRPYLNTILLASAEGDRLDEMMKNQLANPFTQSYGHSDWIDMVTTKPFYECHSVALNAEKLIQYRKLNELNDLF